MIRVYDLEQSEQWNNIINKFEKKDIYYTPNYVKAFELHGDGKAKLIHYTSAEGEAVNVVMLRDIAESDNFVGKLQKDTYFDLSTPYGYGGWLLSNDFSEKNINSLNKEYTDYCKDNNIISEFVRFHPIFNNKEFMKNVYNVVEMGNTVYIDLKSSEIIWKNITSKNRNMIRKALKSGVKIYFGLSDSILNDFIKIYKETMDRDNANSYYYFGENFYKSMLTDLKNNCICFYAKYRDEIIASSLFLLKDKKMHYHLSGSKTEYMRLAPSNLLLYEAAKWGSENGYKTLHLGGGVGSGEDGLYKFKKSFNRNNPTKFAIGKKVFITDQYQYLIEKSHLESVCSGYFPAYRRSI